jgi:hypothetical protein
MKSAPIIAVGYLAVVIALGANAACSISLRAVSGRPATLEAIATVTVYRRRGTTCFLDGLAGPSVTWCESCAISQNAGAAALGGLTRDVQAS